MRLNSVRLLCSLLALGTLVGCGTSLNQAALRRAASTVGAKAVGSWQAYPDAPDARSEAGGVNVGFTLIQVGGNDDQGNRLASGNAFTAFDSWASIPAMSVAREGAAVTDLPWARVAAFGGEAGGQALNVAEMYSTEEKTWTKLPAMPTARRGAGADSDGVFAYVVGGCAAKVPQAAAERFDERDGTWTRLASMSVGREGAVVARLGRRLVAVGGRTPDGVVNTAEIYNLDEGGAWKAIAPMPTARMGAATIVYGNNVFVCGGKTASGAATNAVESFDLVSGTWTRRDPLPEAVEGAVGSKLGERMVITGGRVNGHATKHTWGSPFPFGN